MKFNKENYNDISKEDIVELAEIAYSKMNKLLKRGEKPEYSVIPSSVMLGGITKIAVDEVAVCKSGSSYHIEVDGISIMGLACELPSLKDHIATYGIEEVDNISKNMFSILFSKHSEIQFKLKRDKTLSSLNTIYERLIK